MKKLAIVLLFAILSPVSYAQDGKLDSLFASGDTTAIMDSLMEGFEDFLDSLTAPKSFFVANIGVGTGFFSFEEKNSVLYTSRTKLIISPSLAYYHKSGLGLSATAFVLNDNEGLNFYQFAFSPSYDLLKKDYAAGLSYTHYLRKDSLDFYTTPIQNELFAYFSYKKWWVRPSVNVSVGWGSNTEYSKRRLSRYRLLLSQPNRYFVTIREEESVRDFSAAFSLRKDIDWYNVFGKDGLLTLTPVLMLTSGTQNFGFNTSYSYNFSPIRVNSLPSNREISDNTEFALQSASLALRVSYLKSKLLLQSQVLLDYFLQELPEESSKFNTVFSVSAGWSF